MRGHQRLDSLYRMPLWALELRWSLSGSTCLLLSVGDEGRQLVRAMLGFECGNYPLALVFGLQLSFENEEVLLVKVSH